jgi:putative tricarboxylic transport membrane protein
MTDVISASMMGLIVGLLEGLLPGIGPATSMILLFSVLINMDAVSLLAFFIVMMVSSQYMSSISAIYTGVPGAESAFPSAIKSGYLISNNLTQVAILQNAVSAFVGSILGLCMLMISIPLVSYAYKFFGNGVQFVVIIVTVLALILMSSNKIHAILGILIGSVLMNVGYDGLTYQYHMTFGMHILDNGIPWIPLILGATVGTSIPALIGSKFTEFQVARPLSLRKSIPELRDKHAPMLRGTFIGYFVGMVPGLSYILSASVSYQAEQRVACDTERDRTLNSLMSSDAGHCSGIMGMLLPLLALGIPITMSEAVFLNILTFGKGAATPILTIFSDNLWLLLSIILVANLISLIVALKFSKYLMYILRVPKQVYITSLLLLILASIVDYNWILNNNILNFASFGLAALVFARFRLDPLPFIFSVLVFDMFKSTCYTVFQLYF